MGVSNVAEQSVEENTITMDRRRGDRRGPDAESASVEQESPQRRKKQRRRHIDPTTCERDYNGDEIEFMRAMDDYKRDAGRMFPTCSEVLEVIRGLGYVKLNEDQIAQLQLDDSADEDEAYDFNDEEDSELLDD